MRPAGEMSSASSGSGTFHRASRRILTRPPGPTTRHARGLEKEFRPFGVVDEIVELASGRRLRFFHPRRAASEVGDAGRPHFLLLDRRQQLYRVRAAVAVERR